jgi:hypothetical protein
MIMGGSAGLASFEASGAKEARWTTLRAPAARQPPENARQPQKTPASRQKSPASRQKPPEKARYCTPARALKYELDSERHSIATAATPISQSASVPTMNTMSITVSVSPPVSEFTVL